MSFPTLTFWSRLLATLAVEVFILAALGFAAQHFVRPASGRRAAWLITVICLLLLPASEWTGLGRGAADFLFGRKRVVESAPVSSLMAVKPQPAGLPLLPLIHQTALAKPAVWWPEWVWLAGAGIVLARMAAARILLLVLRLRRGKITSGPLRGRIIRVSRRVGLRRNVCPLWMPEAMSPMAFGIFRPSIGLPPGFSDKLSETEQDAVLAHELAHLAAFDPLWFLLADLASAALWWHPMAWWVRRSLHGAAELAADDATVLVPDGPGALAKCLVSLGREMTAARGWGWVGIRGGFRSKLGKRVERLMRLSGDARRPSAGWAIAAGLCAIPAMVLMFASLQAAPAQKAASLRDELRDSWDNSPGGRLLLAALETNPVPADAIAKTPAGQKQAIDIATRVQNAKLLYEMGKYDDAEKMLNQVLKDDPSNHTAPYYLDLIKEARYSKAQSQIMIEAKFVELSPEDSKGLGFNWRLGNTETTNNAAGPLGGSAPPTQGHSTSTKPSGIFPGPGSLAPAPGPLTGVMTDPLSRFVVQAIEQRAGAELLAAPKVITVSGRQAHVGIEEPGEAMSLDVIPTVNPDGFSIRATVIPSVIKGGRTWRLTDTRDIPDGHTLVLGAWVTNQPAGQRKMRLVFVSFRIIDATGNPVHSDKETSDKAEPQVIIDNW